MRCFVVVVVPLSCLSTRSLTDSVVCDCVYSVLNRSLSVCCSHRALHKGARPVKPIIITGSSLKNARDGVRLCKKYPDRGLYTTVGAYHHKMCPPL
jgi:hypothetical protein